MRLESLLFRGDITVKRVRREGDELVLDTDPSDSVPGSLYTTPKDIVGLIRLSITPSVIGYIALLPLHYFRWKRRQRHGSEIFP
jgi:hypothetical protein